MLVLGRVVGGYTKSSSMFIPTKINARRIEDPFCQILDVLPSRWASTMHVVSVEPYWPTDGTMGLFKTAWLRPKTPPKTNMEPKHGGLEIVFSRGVALGVEFEIGKGGHLRPLAATCRKRPLAATCGHLTEAATCGHLRPLALCGHLRSLAATCPLRPLAVTCGHLLSAVTCGHWAGLVGHLLQRPLAATCGQSSGCKWLQVTANNEIHCP